VYKLDNYELTEVLAKSKVDVGWLSFIAAVQRIHQTLIQIRNFEACNITSPRNFMVTLIHNNNRSIHYRQPK